MALIKGITIILFDKVQTGVDAFNVPTFAETPVTIENVLVTPVTSTDAPSQNALQGKKATYEICIPKADTHVWEDRTVAFFGHKFHTIGFCKEWIDANIPLAWNKKIEVERYG